MKGIADTGFIVAFGNRADHYHQWALEIAGNVTQPLLTCEAVLAEASFHLGSTAYVLTLIEDKLLRVAFDCKTNSDRLLELARKYDDRKPDLADLCLVLMSEMYPKHVIITTDSCDFTVYRRFRRERIPILNPRSS